MFEAEEDKAGPVAFDVHAGWAAFCDDGLQWRGGDVTGVAAGRLEGSLVLLDVELVTCAGSPGRLTGGGDLPPKRSRNARMRRLVVSGGRNAR